MPSKSRVTRLYASDQLQSNYLRYFERCISNWVVVNGKPDLRAQNPHQYLNDAVVQRIVVDPGSLFPSALTAVETTRFACDQTAIESKATESFNRKLRKGHASLGVTLGSWSQSSSMIRNRIHTAASAVDRGYSLLKSDPRRLRRLRRERDPLANLVLETEFGWRPLFDDVRSAFGVMCRDDLPGTWVRGSHRESFAVRSDVPNLQNGFRSVRSGFGRAVVAANVAVTNPNAYLLNQLGLINPAEVIWDLIPWSFLVGMVSNMNSLLTSFTAEVGLTVRNRSTTFTAHTEEDLLRWIVSGGSRSYSLSRAEQRYKVRSVGAFTPVQFSLHWPKGDWETVLILSSLLLQRFKKVSDLLRV